MELILKYNFNDSQKKNGYYNFIIKKSGFNK